MTADYIIRTYTEARTKANRARATMNTSTGRMQGAAADELEFWSNKSACMAAAAAKFGVELPVVSADGTASERIRQFRDHAEEIAATLTFDEWKTAATTDRAEMEQESERLFDLIQEASQRAGIGRYMGNIVGNAMIARDEGRPWREVDYSALEEVELLVTERNELGRAYSVRVQESMRRISR